MALRLVMVYKVVGRVDLSTVSGWEPPQRVDASKWGDGEQNVVSAPCGLIWLVLCSLGKRSQLRFASKTVHRDSNVAPSAPIAILRSKVRTKVLARKDLSSLRWAKIPVEGGKVPNPRFMEFDADSTAALIFAGFGIEATLHCASISFIFRLRGRFQFAILVELAQKLTHFSCEAPAAFYLAAEDVLHEDDFLCAAIAHRIHAEAVNGFERACNCPEPSKLLASEGYFW